jgi:repressor LexA
MTKRQAELLQYIKGYIEKNGYSPSYAEMLQAMSLKSKSGIHRMIQSLEKRGKIKIVKYMARSVEVNG